jgi:PAS domain S-box-containing protein
MSQVPKTLVVRFKPESLDQIPLGMLRISTAGEAGYLNRAAQAMAGPDLRVGRSLFALDFDAGSRARLIDELEQRRRTQCGASYPITLRRSDLGTLVRLQVSAVPEYDADGSMIGSAAFVTDTTMELVNRSIHDAIGAARDWRGLLGALNGTLRDLIAFDALTIALISEDRGSLRAFFQAPEQVSSVPLRWWPMPELVKVDLDDLTRTRADCIEELFSRSPYAELAKTDKPTQDWLKLGYTGLLRRPVMRGNRIVAIVSLQRVRPEPFSQQDIDRLEQLPIGEAVNMALALEREEELAFGLGLIGRMGSVASRIEEVARVLVDELRAHFGWPHVSLFRVDRDRDLLSMVYQAADGTAWLPQHYRQSIGTGLLGQVAATGQHVRLDDVHTSPTYVMGVVGTMSEMCLPVPGLEMRWILNAESSLRGAFADEERRAVEPILEVAGLILDRTTALEFKSTVLESIADAVIQTSSRGAINDVNKAAEGLLGRSREELLGVNLAELISAPGDDPDPPGFAARVVAMERVKPAEIELLPAQGSSIPVLISGNSLPEQIGGKVYVASDLRYERQVQRMDALRKLFRQVASEIRVPLSLASTYLDQAAKVASGASLKDLVDKTIKQLRRADLPLERVVRLAADDDDQELPLHCVDLSALAAGIIGELPKGQIDEIVVSLGNAPAQVWAAGRELRFCAHSVLAFLLRMKAQQDRVQLHIGAERGCTMLSFELVDASSGQPSATRLIARSEHEREFALAESVIESLMMRMRGAFELHAHEMLRFCLLLRPWGKAT